VSFVARLRSELIAVSPPWRTFEDTIRGLAACLAAARLLPTAAEQAAVEAVVAREAEASTALLDIGVGVPHAPLAGITRPIVALGLSSEGLYEAVPTVSIRIVALVLSPPGSGADHLRLLSGIATLLRSTDLRARLLAARDGSEALASLRGHARVSPV
jgi:PTS system fructose-specific IIC component